MSGPSMAAVNKVVAEMLAEDAEWQAENPPLYLRIMYPEGKAYDDAVKNHREFHLSVAAAMRKRAS